jgi:serine/threonine protein kinase/WD40 repeat protein
MAAMGDEPTPCGWSFNGCSDGSYPKRLGDYQLIREIARGGMGIVWLARQISLHREVALKILPPVFASDPVRVARFQSEASLAARLRHPHIVSVHEIGDLEGVVFYSMDYVRGQDLSRKDASRFLRPRQVLELIKSVAEAVQYAHDNGVLHRDLKPSNILIDDTGHPWIVDFGLARLIDEDSSITQTGEIVGSPAFIAPEHIASTDVVPTERGDVYGLGVLLYYCLTQRAPYVADTVSATLQKVLTTNPLPIRSIRADVSEDIESIANRCLAKDPEERYPTAAAVASDLERVLEGKPLRRPQVPVPKPPRRKWLTRRMAIGLTVVSVPVAVGLSGWSSFRGMLFREAYLQEKAERQHREILDRYVDEVVLADQALGKGDARKAERLLDDLGSRPGMRDHLGLEWFWLRSQLAGIEAQKAWRMGEPLLSFSPLTEEGCFAVATATGISIVSAKAGEPELYRGLPGLVDGRRIERDSTARNLWVGDDLGLHRLDMGSGAMTTVVPDSIVQVRKSPSGNRLAVMLGRVGGEDAGTEVLVLEAMEAHTLARFGCESGTVLAFLTDETLEGIGPTGQRWRWRVGQRQIPEIRKVGESGIISFAAAPNLARFAQVDESSRLRIQRQRGSLLELDEEVARDAGNRLAFSERGDFLVHASPAMGKAWIRSAPDWRVHATLEQVPQGLVDIHISTTPPTVFLASQDGTFQRRTWASLGSEGVIASDQSPVGVGEAIISPDGRWIAFGSGQSRQSTTWIRDLSGGDRCLFEIPGRPLAFAPSAELILQSHGQDQIAVWDLKERIRLAEFRSGIPSGGLPERISGDGSMLVVVDPESRVRVVHLMTGLEIRGPKGRIRDFRISPDSRRLAFLTPSGAGIYEFGSGEQWHCAQGTFTTMEFSPDGRNVALGDETGSLRVHDLEGRVCVAERAVQNAPIQAMAFLGDGRTLATGGGVDGIRLWSVPGLRAMTRIPTDGVVGWLGARAGHTALLVQTEDGVRMMAAPNPQAPPPRQVRKEGGFWEDPVAATVRLSKSRFREPIAFNTGEESSAVDFLR